MADGSCNDLTAALLCACIQRLDDVQDSPTDTKFLQHLPRYSTRYSIECLLEVNKATVQLASFPFLSKLLLFGYQ